MTTPSALPVVDMSLLDGDPGDAAAFRKTLLSAAHDVGFFSLVGHGIPSSRIEELFATARAFFALPERDKLELEMVRSPHFRGYTRTGGERTQGRVDWREQIDLGPERDAVHDPDTPAYMRLEGPNQWPAAQPDLRRVVEAWSQECSAVALRLLREWAVALHAPRDVFDAAFADAPSTLVKLITYPGRDVVDGQGVGAHKDPGVLTLLMVEPGKAGLQVEHDGPGSTSPPSRTPSW